MEKLQMQKHDHYNAEMYHHIIQQRATMSNILEDDVEIPYEDDDMSQDEEMMDDEEALSNQLDWQLDTAIY